MPAPVSVVDAHLDAYNARDLERFVSCYAPSVVIKNSTGEVMAEGQHGMRAMYGPLFEASPELAGRITNRIVVGNFVADHEQVEGFNLPGYSTSLQAIAVYEVIGGMISKVGLFF